MSKHEAIIYGVKLMKTWQLEYRLTMYSYPFRVKQLNYSDKKIDAELWSGELDFPPVNVGDKIYISESDIYVTVDEIIRTTFNEYIYKTSHVVEEFISESLEEDRLNAIEEWMQEEYSNYSKFEELKFFKPVDNVVTVQIPDEESRKRNTWFSLARYFKK